MVGITAVLSLYTGPWGADTVDGSVGQVLVIFLLAAVIYRTWRRSRSAAGGSGQGLP
jgi:hypothetical protein